MEGRLILAKRVCNWEGGHWSCVALAMCQGLGDMLTYWLKAFGLEVNSHLLSSGENGILNFTFKNTVCSWLDEMVIECPFESYRQPRLPFFLVLLTTSDTLPSQLMDRPELTMTIGIGAYRWYTYFKVVVGFSCSFVTFCLSLMCRCQQADMDACWGDGNQ